MDKCECWYSAQRILGWWCSDVPIVKDYYQCYGTREREECHCGGDKSKCDFYPEVREKAKTDDAITAEAYNAMFKDLEFRTKQVLELQNKNKQLKKELNDKAERKGMWIPSPNINECVVCSECMSDGLSAQVIAPAPHYYRFCPMCGRPLK